MNTALLLSGGMDSVALAWWKRPSLAYTVDYGQASAGGEIRSARHVCSTLGVPHEIISVDCASLGSGDMAGRAPCAVAPVPEWWPFRNQLLITLAGMRAIHDGVQTILFGAVRTDGIHCDGTPGFFGAIDGLLAMQEGAVRVEAPAIHLSSAELVRTSGIGLDLLSWAHSCHVAEYACGSCRGCLKHQQVMAELGYETY